MLDRFDSDSRRRRHNLAKVLAANEGEVLLHGELWRSGDREILNNWEKKKKKKISKLIPRKLKLKKLKKNFNQWRKMNGTDR